MASEIIPFNFETQSTSIRLTLSTTWRNLAVLEHIGGLFRPVSALFLCLKSAQGFW